VVFVAVSQHLHGEFLHFAEWNPVALVAGAELQIVAQLEHLEEQWVIHVMQ